MYTLGRGGALGDAQTGPPLGHWANGPRRETAAAIRADIMQDGLHAVGAEGAFIRADARVGRIRRQVLVAIFAVRPKLECHVCLVASRSARWHGGARPCHRSAAPARSRA